MKKISRIFALAAAMAMAAVLCLGLASCGGANPEKLITDSVNKELTQLKTLDASTLKELTDNMGSDTDDSFKLLNISAEDFCKQLFDGFDYKVENVKVDGKTAVASVSFTMKDVGAALQNFSTEFQAMVSDLDSIVAQYAGKSTEEIQQSLYSKAGQMLMDSLKKADTKTATLDIKYELQGNAWTPTSDISNLFTDAFMGDLSSFF